MAESQMRGFPSADVANCYLIAELRSVYRRSVQDWARTAKLSQFVWREYRKDLIALANARRQVLVCMLCPLRNAARSFLQP